MSPEKVRLKTKIGTVHLVGAYCCDVDAPEFRLATVVWGPFLPRYRHWNFAAVARDATNGLRVGDCAHRIDKGHEGTMRCVSGAIEAYLKDNPDWLKAALLSDLDESIGIHLRTWEMTKNLNQIVRILRCAKHWASNFGETYRGRSPSDYSDLLKETTDFGARLWDTLGASPLGRPPMAITESAPKSVKDNRHTNRPAAATSQAA
jgi:hypothetical protein